MIVFVLTGLLITICLKRNPITIVQNSDFNKPFLMIGALLLQIFIAVLANIGIKTSPYFLDATFLLFIVGLYYNRKLAGIPLIAIGATINLIALLSNGGLMPVSPAAMEMAGVDRLALVGEDSRHQIVEDPNLWWIGDIIPFFKHVISPGDVFVGIGIILYMVKTSTRWR
jgi:hypothetical protein